MSRKDYILIVEPLRVHYLRLLHKHLETRVGENRFNPQHSPEASAVWDVALEIADSLKRDNPRFDRNHFMDVVRGDKELNSRPSRNGGR